MPRKKRRVARVSLWIYIHFTLPTYTLFSPFIADRIELDAQVSTENTFGEMQANGRQQSTDQRSTKGRTQNVHFPGGDLHRGYGLPKSTGKNVDPLAIRSTFVYFDNPSPLNLFSFSFLSRRSRS